MTLTLLDLYNECAGQPWSMYDGDAETIDDLESALKISINKATSYLWNLYPWSFKVKTRTLKTKPNVAKYNAPNGLITKEVIDGITRFGVTYNDDFISFLPNYKVLEDKVRVHKNDDDRFPPEGFYISGDKLYIYPTPDDIYELSIDYLLLPYGLNIEDEQITELVEDTDRINIPEKYEKLFKNCLISKAMLYAIADETDENYSGYLNQYNDALETLTQYCLDTTEDKYIVW